jgi:hypothetical protein
MGRVTATPLDPARPAESPFAPPGPPRWLRDVRVSAAVAAAVTLLGLPMAALWHAVAPTPLVAVGAAGPTIAETSGKAWIGGDAWFAVIGVVAGLVCAFAAYRWSREHGVAVVVGLAVGGMCAALIMWRLGGWLGPDSLSSQSHGGKTLGTYHLPLQLRAKGVLFAWPLFSVIASFGLVAGLQRPEPVSASPWPAGAWGAPQPLPGQSWPPAPQGDRPWPPTRPGDHDPWAPPSAGDRDSG